MSLWRSYVSFILADIAQVVPSLDALLAYVVSVHGRQDGAGAVASHSAHGSFRLLRACLLLPEGYLPPREGLLVPFRYLPPDSEMALRELAVARKCSLRHWKSR